MEYRISLLGGMNADDTFFSGQAFRWHKSENDYIGIVGQYSANVQVLENEVVINASGGTLEFWQEYFAADINYEKLREIFMQDKNLAPCVEYAKGIRVLRQPFFETLSTFIISQNNNIPRIEGLVQRFCESFGEKLAHDRFAFPLPSVIAQQTVESLAPLRAGFRAKYLIDAAQKVSRGLVCEQQLRQMSAEESRKSLCTILGVGPKVADCVMLFSLGKNEIIPMDVHMKRAMQERFPNGLSDSIAPYGGIAQQYIFHHERTNKHI